MKKLYKLKSEGKLTGVCAGLADYFNMSVNLVRIITCLLCCFFNWVILLYALLAFFLPNKNN